MTAKSRHYAIRIRRVYTPPDPEDGERVLVDRLWPRGLKKGDAVIDLWLKEVAPSAELRRWFGHDAARFDEFRACYAAELRALHAAQDMTLLFAAHDEFHNNASVLRDILTQD